MEALKTQLYPYKEHPEILKDFFGIRLKKSIDDYSLCLTTYRSLFWKWAFGKRNTVLYRKGTFLALLKKMEAFLLSLSMFKSCQQRIENSFLLNTDFKWGLKGIVREESERYLKYSIPCEYNGIGGYSEGFYKVRIGMMYGFAPLVEGNFGIFPQYQAVKPFHEGFAAVRKDGKWSFIDKMQRHVTDFEFDVAESFSDGIARVWKGLRRYQIDFNGNDITDSKCVSGSSLKKIGKYNEGLCAVTKDGRLGFVDIFGNIVILLEYEEPRLQEEIPVFSEGFACVRKGYYWGYIDKQNRTVIPFVFSYYSKIHDGMAFVHDGNRMNLYQLLTCKHFYDYSYGDKIPFCLERQPPKPSSHDAGWSSRDLQDAYEATYEV